MDARTPKAKTTYALHYGSTERPLAAVVPDSRWPGMWRIAWPDGELSDMANLSRAKDAAEVICATGRKSSLLHWKRHGCERPLEAATGALAADDDSGAA
jgi:hypothetical protein